jgi:beta-N-acetylhexosaminidase
MADMGERPREPRSFLRELRSRLPVSPLPWHWHRRINRGTLVAIIVGAAAFAVTSVLIQRAGNEESERAAEIQASPEVKGKLRGLSLEQKADAVLVTGFDDAADAEAELDDSELGGIAIGSDDWAKGGSGVLARLRRAGSGDGRTPPLIVGQQEGGGYRSYSDLPPDQLQVEVGDLGDPAQAQAWAKQTGEEMKSAGFDLNLAPVADVATLDSPIADRAFGDDPELVAAMTAAAVTGCAESGLACAVSHFPGLGGANSDPANGPATVSLDQASLEARDLSAFRAAFAAGAPATMLSLAFYAAFDPVTPAALSPGIATDLLRDELGFKGVAVTDDLTSGAIAGGVGAPEAAVQALAAGSDLVVIDDPIQAKQSRAAILAAAKSGALPPSRLDQAVGRVLELKRSLGLLPR